jgi:hypothetical protein
VASEFRVSYVYSKSLARRAYLSLLWESQSGLVLTTPVGFVWALAYFGNEEYAALCGFVLGVVLMIWLHWLAGVRQSVRVAAANGFPDVTLVMNDEECSFATPHARSIAEWRAFARLYRLKHVWILVRKGSAQATTVPAEVLSADARAFLEGQVSQAGGRLR